ncbi:MAG: ABC transporter ATP-binding protein, partial [Thermoplasmata archaeon]
MIEIENLKKIYNGTIAIEDINLKIAKGEVFVILGPNGAGKTTTIRILTCLINPTQGNAYVNGMSILDEKKKIRKISGILTENPGFYERFNAMENLRFFSSLYGMEKNKIDQNIEYYLKMFDLWDRRNEPVGNFSRGMKQKLALIRSLIHDPDYIYLDEPTASLDPETSKVVRDFIKKLKNEGRTIVLNTHNLSEAEYLADHIAILKTRILAFGTPDELRERIFGKRIIIEFSGDRKLIENILNSFNLIYKIENSKVVLYQPKIKNSIIIEKIVSAGIGIEYVYDESHNLEDIYLEMVKN